MASSQVMSCHARMLVASFLLATAALANAHQHHQPESSRLENRPGSEGEVSPPAVVVEGSGPGHGPLPSAILPGTVDCTEETFLPDPTDPTIFYRCVETVKGDFEVFKFWCRDGRKWDQERQVCRYDSPLPHPLPRPPSNAETIGTIGTESTASGRACDKEGFFPDPTDPTRFYRCIGAGSGRFISFEFRCTDGRKWDQERQECRYDPLVPRPLPNFHQQSTGVAGRHDDVPVEFAQLATTSLAAVSNVAHCKKEGFLPHPSDPSQFYRCLQLVRGGFKAFNLWCNGGRHWDQEGRVCRYDSAVPKPLPKIRVPEGPAKPQHSGESGSDDAPLTTTAPSHDVDQGNTDKSVVAPGSTEISDQDTTDRNNRTSEASIEQGRPVEEPTEQDGSEQRQPPIEGASGEESDQDATQQPPHSPEDAGEETRPEQSGSEESTPSTPDPSRSAESTAPPSSEISEERKPFAECTEEGFFGDSTDKSKFYRCVPFGDVFLKYEFTCPLGTVWDDDIETCNFENGGGRQSGRNVSASTTDPLPEAGTSAHVLCPIARLAGEETLLTCPSVLRQHPRYCNLFYQCTNLSAFKSVVLLRCPRGRIFDEERAMCILTLAKKRKDCLMYDAPASIQSADTGIKLINAPATRRLCPGKGGFAYGTRCPNTYVECKHNEKKQLVGHVRTCPNQHIFSPVKAECLFYKGVPLCKRGFPAGDSFPLSDYENLYVGLPPQQV